METIYNDISNQINLLPLDHSVLIYIGVGTAAGMVTPGGVLEGKNYHQSPPLLQHLRDTISTLRIFTVLIDPNQEDPVYLVRTGNDRNNRVYTLREDVYTDSYEVLGTNITEALRQFNGLAVRTNSSLIYHDFTGRKVKLIADYFDGELGPHLDHIIYGLSAREDHGCYFDLSAPNSFMPFRVEQTGGRPLIKFYNIFRQLRGNMRSDLDLFPSYFWPLAENQGKQVLNSISAHLRNTVLSNLRVAYRLMTGVDRAEELNPWIFSSVSRAFQDQVQEYYQGRLFAELYQFLLLCYSPLLDDVAKIQQMDLTGREILDFIIAGPDCYKWYDHIKEFIPV